jgi:hypothetical protein
MSTFWISKYALTQGVYSVEAEEPTASIPSMISVRQKTTYSTCYHGEGRDWHRTEAEARTKANKMVQDKIKSLKKQLKKLEVMEF